MWDIDWTALGQYISWGVIAGIGLSLRKAFQIGQLMTEFTHRVEALERRDTAIERLLRDAGEKQSELATTIQHWPRDPRQEFISRQLAEAWRDEGARDRQALWRELENLRRIIERRPVER